MPQSPSKARETGKMVLSRAKSLVSGCKINLYLEITGRLDNGYHSLKTFMLPLRKPQDTLIVRPGLTAGLRLDCAESSIDPRDNTLSKAYSLYEETLPQLPDLHITLNKGVPQGAGLGGGSADAAALLLFLDETARRCGCKPLGREKLMDVAARVGADVPFFIMNRPAWAEGIGEKLGEMPPPFVGWTLVLVCPSQAVSTAWAYSAWDDLNNDRTSSTRTLTSTCSQATYFPSAEFGVRHLFNSFEAVVFKEYPALREIKRLLLEHGASGAMMSGSGSSLFGLFEQADKAAAAAAVLRRAGLQVFVQAI